MRYYVLADIHGFFDIMQETLREAGYFDDPTDKMLVICGDVMDRGSQACQMQDYIVKLLEAGQVTIIRGNHEDLFVSLVTEDRGIPYSHHVSNGTFDTALQLTGFTKRMSYDDPMGFCRTARSTPYYTTIIPATIDYLETPHYIFVHGYIPVHSAAYDISEGCTYREDWRTANASDWSMARWTNGMDAARYVIEPTKTIVCGHFHTSYGHAKIEHACSEYGADADFSIYRANGIIALDACTSFSKRMNILVIDD